MATDFNRIFSLTAFTALLLICSVHLSYSCNEQVCASIVSKCMLTQSCKCDSQNYSCCVECFKCLGHLQLECCSCLGKFEINHYRNLALHLALSIISPSYCNTLSNLLNSNFTDQYEVDCESSYEPFVFVAYLES